MLDPALVTKPNVLAGNEAEPFIDKGFLAKLYTGKSSTLFVTVRLEKFKLTVLEEVSNVVKF